MCKLNRTVKYVMCAAVTVVLTVTIVFLPYAYYYVKDVNDSSKYNVESFTLDSSSSDLSYNSILTLASLEDTVWIDESDKISEEEIDSTPIAAVKEFSGYFPDNYYIERLFETVLNDPGLKADYYEAEMLSGADGVTPMSVSFLYVEYIGENFERMSVLLDRQTGMLYQLTIEANDDSPFYGKKDDSENDGANRYYYSETDENEIVNAAGYGAYKYWRNIPDLVVDCTLLDFRIFGMSYFEMKNKSEMVYEYDSGF